MHQKYVLCASKLCIVQLGENKFVYMHNFCVAIATGLTHRPVLKALRSHTKLSTNFWDLAVLYD